MKRILVITLAYHPFEGGAEVALRQVFRRLKNKADFTILTARLGSVPRKELVEGIPVRRIGVGVPWIDKLLFLPMAVIYGLFSRCDVVFSVLANQAALAGRAVSWLKRKPLIINLQSGDTEKYIKSKLGIFYFLYKLVYSKKAEYAVLSHFLKKRAIAHGVDEIKITIIPNGVDAGHFKCSGEKRQKGLIVTTSRLTVKNGVDDLIKSFKIVVEEVPEAKLAIFGSGEDEDALKQLVKKLNLEQSVEFKGSVPHESLPAKLCRAEVFVRPSISEGFGNSFIEALACGVPIVGTAVGGIPDFLEHEKTGLFAKVRNPEDIAKQIIRLIEDRGLAERIVSNGRRMIEEKYDWDIIAEQYARVFSCE